MVNRTASEWNRSSLSISKAKFLTALRACEDRVLEQGNFNTRAREQLGQLTAGAGLTVFYFWCSPDNTRVAALSLDSTGRFFATDRNQAEPVSVAQGWAFMLACREWAACRQVEDSEAACRWEEAILRQLQQAEETPRKVNVVAP